MRRPPTEPPSHCGWMAVVPIWAWDVEAAGPTLKPRWFLPGCLLEFVAGLQVLACEVIGDEPAFLMTLRPLTTWGARWWRIERWLAGERAA